MGSFASTPETPAEQMKKYKREVDRGVRELDRERARLERELNKLANDLRKESKSGRPETLKIMAKSYVRSQRQIRKFMLLKTHLQGLSMQLTTMKSVDTMSNAMKNATRAMIRMNARMNMPQLQAIMRSFGIETAKMEDSSEMMSDSLDEMFADSEEEEESDSIVAKVMTELNISMTDKMPVLPTGAAATAAPAAAAPTRTAAAAAAGAGGPAPATKPTSPPPAGGAASGSGAPSGTSPPPPPSTSATVESMEERLARLREKKD